MRRVALCLMAHPDDAEFLAAGTLALLSERGWEIHLATATPGDAGTATATPTAIAATRRAEAAAAARHLGAAFHCLELRDLHVTYDADAIDRALRLTRSIAPTLLITHSPADYMPDHEVTAQLARTAALGYFVPNACGGPPAAHQAVPHLYYADPVGLIDHDGRPAACGLIVDISTTFARKLAMLQEHASQRAWLQTHFGNDEYTESVRAWSQSRGRQVGVPWGEGFRQHRGYGHPSDCLLSRELGALAHHCGQET